MEKRETKTYTIEFAGSEWDATVNWWEYGRGQSDEIDVIVQNEHHEPQNQKHTFRVAEPDDREAVFVKCDVDGRAKPTTAVMRALYRFGWSCTNHTLEGLRIQDAKYLRSALEYSDSTLSDAMRYNDKLEDYPMLFDLLEAGVTAIAAVNSFVGDAYDDKGRFDPGEDFEAVIHDEEAMRGWARGRASNDPYYYLLMAPLLRVHHGIDLTPEEVATIRHEETTDLMESVGIVPPDSYEDFDFRSEDFDGPRYADWFANKFF